ncbi:MerR family transcriptional regulator [Desulfosporosinus sp. FKB]|uniref:MerR family transcriptional regulator n=1 Tax=Desulfosporosinus sp. FKB TaxID=1969835 RepID=UPI000B49CFB2|nr:MerR family transcriptional regulator [Desulfosporosinus sp. FKB]
MNISTLSKKTGVSVRSLRYYESKNLLQSRRLENGYRDYDEIAVQRVKIIQLYLGLGLNTDEIERVIECPINWPNEQPLCEKAYKLYHAKLTEVNKQIELLEMLKSRLQQGISIFENTIARKDSNNDN